MTATAYRQRLLRARARLDAFGGTICGFVGRDAPCRCGRQLPALRHLAAAAPAAPRPVLAIHRAELADAERQFDAFVRIGDAAAVFRAHPEYRAPESLYGAIRAVLRREGFWGDDRPVH